MDALLALVRDRPAAFTTQPISREFDEAGVKRDRRWSEELREREHVRNRPTRLLRPIRLMPVTGQVCEIEDALQRALCTRAERSDCRRAAKERDELASPHSSLLKPDQPYVERAYSSTYQSSGGSAASSEADLRRRSYCRGQASLVSSADEKRVVRRRKRD
jgi:hypothetical protein